MPDLLIVQGDARSLPLTDGNVDCVITSPPYFRQRVYPGLPPTQWPAGTYTPMPGIPPVALPAWEGCLGEEPSEHLYLLHLVHVMREVRRVMKPWGVAWVNLADTMGPDGSWLGIPDQFHLAMRGDGWWVRDRTTWVKAAPRPDSLKGTRWEQRRCACIPSQPDSAQSKRERGTQRLGSHLVGQPWGGKPDPACPQCHGSGKAGEVVLRAGTWRATPATEAVFMLARSRRYWSDAEAVREPATTEYSRDGRRNPRNVVIPTGQRPVGTGHYATFPPSLLTRFIESTCPRRCCVGCGRGWAPVVGRWESKPACGCAPGTGCLPGIVLDPFCGSGQALIQARALGRRGIGVERNLASLRISVRELDKDWARAWTQELFAFMG